MSNNKPYCSYLYLIDSLGSGNLTFKQLFLFYFHDSSAEGLINGQDTLNLLILLAVAPVALGLAIVIFRWRDLTVGVWPWQRGRRPATV